MLNNLRTHKKTIIIAFTTLLLGIVLIVVLFLKQTSEDTYNQDKQNTPSYPLSYISSYPVSYNNIGNNDSELIPVNAESLIKSVNTEQYCGVNENGFKANLGIVTYRYSTGNFNTHDENNKALMINNINTVVGQNNDADFAEVIDYINNKKDLKTLKDLPAFNYACTGSGAASYIKAYSVDYPGMNNAIAYIYVGGTQYAWLNLTDVKFTIKVLAYKDNNVIQLSEYFEGAELFNQEQVLTCRITSEYGHEYLNMDCIRDLYLQTESAQDKVDKRTKDLIEFFEFK